MNRHSSKVSKAPWGDAVGKLGVLSAVAVILVAGAAGAWQYEDEIVLDQMGSRPGGGGNWATGGRREFKVTCAMCHLLPDAGFTNRINVTVGFSPMLGTAPDGGRSYLPNTNYDVTVSMNGEHLGTIMGGNHNQFAATFENAQGQYVGRLQSDTGFAKGGSCPATLGNPQFMAYDAGSSTVTFAGCNAIVGRGRGANAGGRTQWRFAWQAPAPDAGQVTMFYGVVDADSDEKTIGDDAVMGTLVMEQQ
ncbi:MAG: hypothetical protein JNM17_28610 [Archangium sp.]|nr:hypothetical protein [Archangium sp.]